VFVIFIDSGLPEYVSPEEGAGKQTPKRHFSNIKSTTIDNVQRQNNIFQFFFMFYAMQRIKYKNIKESKAFNMTCRL
jgi:hypothetical protein